ncbi:MAG: hypothetical protein V1857_06535 [archaeon]
MGRAFCRSCRTELTPEDKVCPNCGSGDREVTISNGLRVMEMITIKRIPAGKKNYVSLSKSGEKISGKTHRPAREDMTIDRGKKHKRHYVEEQDESGKWQVVRDYDGPLDEKKKQAAKRGQHQQENK